MIKRVSAGQPTSSTQFNEIIDKVNELDNRATVIVHQPDTRLNWKEVIIVAGVSIALAIIVSSVIMAIFG